MRVIRENDKLLNKFRYLIRMMFYFKYIISFLGVVTGIPVHLT